MFNVVYYIRSTYWPGRAFSILNSWRWDNTGSLGWLQSSKLSLFVYPFLLVCLLDFIMASKHMSNFWVHSLTQAYNSECSLASLLFQLIKNSSAFKDPHNILNPIPIMLMSANSTQWSLNLIMRRVWKALNPTLMIKILLCYYKHLFYDFWWGHDHNSIWCWVKCNLILKITYDRTNLSSKMTNF